MKNGTNPQKPSVKDRIQQLGALAGFIVDFLATLLSYEQVNYWLGKKTELKKKLREGFSIIDEFSDIREEWKKFYKTHFNWDVDFSEVIIPPMPTVGKWRLLFIAKGMTLNLAFKVCEKLFPSWKYCNDLDKEISKNICDTSNHYAVWIRDEVEPDTEFLGKSTREVDSEMKIGITLLERIILEIKYFAETGNHLDIKSLTFCSGSRYSDGDVPGADWSSGGFRVVWCHLGRSGSSYGIRSAVRL
jgi:hypothetical protein